jgi:hypothetical protein
MRRHLKTCRVSAERREVHLPCPHAPACTSTFTRQEKVRWHVAELHAFVCAREGCGATFARSAAGAYDAHCLAHRRAEEHEEALKTAEAYVLLDETLERVKADRAALEATVRALRAELDEMRQERDAARERLATYEAATLKLYARLAENSENRPPNAPVAPLRIA